MDNDVFYLIVQEDVVEIIEVGMQGLPGPPGEGMTPDIVAAIAAADRPSGENPFGTISAISALIAALVNSSPAALDTLNELAAALGNDPNFATTIATALGGKEPTLATMTQQQAEDQSSTAKVATTGQRIWQAIAKWAETGLNGKLNATGGTATNLSETKQPPITGSVSSIDWSAGHVTIDYAGNTNISSGGFTNVPTTGKRAFLSIFFKHNGGARTLTLPSTVKSTITLAGTSGKWDHIVLWTDDGGTNIYGQVVESK
jgi:hypothetical protein